MSEEKIVSVVRLPITHSKDVIEELTQQGGGEPMERTGSNR